MKRQRLTVPIEVEAVVDATLQDILDDEVKSLQFRQIVAPRFGRAAMAKHRQHPLFRRLFGNNRVATIIVRNDTDV